MDTILEPKAYNFALHIVELYKWLCTEKKEFILSKQAMRSGTSIGALVREAAHAQSRADFLNKMNVALKEANETQYWLMLLKDSCYLPVNKFDSLHNDCGELIRLLASIVKTTKKSLNK